MIRTRGHERLAGGATTREARPQGTLVEPPRFLIIPSTTNGKGRLATQFGRVGYIVNSMFTRFGLNQYQCLFEVFLRSF